MKRFLLVLFCICFVSCGFFGVKINTGDLSDAYKAQAALNPEKICSPQMLEKVFLLLKEKSYYRITRKQLYDSANKVLGEVKNNSYPGAFHIWAKIDFVARKTGKKRSDLCYAVINGIVKDVKKIDRWAHFVDAKRGVNRFGSMVGADYCGIGFVMKVDHKNKRIFVDFVYEDSPAKRGGLKRFDEIIGINGKKIDIKTAPYKFRGKEGSKIKLLIRRKDKKFHEKLLTFTREIIPHNDARCKMMGKVAYCKVFGFTKNTVDNLVNGFNGLSGNPHKVIIDLRNNPGGLLYSATNFLNMAWIKNKSLAILAKKKHGFVSHTDNTYKKQLFNGKKVIVLINGSSASATELVAAAIKDYSAATLLGETTYGKGVSQSVHFILGAVFSYTSMFFLSPHGKIINKHGVAPDIKVKMSWDDYINHNDIQLNKALELLRK